MWRSLSDSVVEISVTAVCTHIVVFLLQIAINQRGHVMDTIKCCLIGAETAENSLQGPEGVSFPQMCEKAFWNLHMILRGSCSPKVWVQFLPRKGECSHLCQCRGYIPGISIIQVHTELLLTAACAVTGDVWGSELCIELLCCHVNSTVMF